MFRRLPTFFGPLVAIETDIRIADEILCKGHWEFQDTMEIMAVYEKHYSNRIGTMLDLGCNIGSWTLPLAQRYPDNKIMAFDCQLRAVVCLRQTAELNHLNNVTAHYSAVSDHCETRVYNTIDYDWGANFGAYEFEKPFANSDFNGKTTDQTDTVDVITVDSLNLNDLVFMKLDIEGMELKALKGAVETILCCRPFITFEHHKTDRRAAEELLTKLDYRVLHNTIGQMTLAVPN